MHHQQVQECRGTIARSSSSNPHPYSQHLKWQTIWVKVVLLGINDYIFENLDTSVLEILSTTTVPRTLGSTRATPMLIYLELNRSDTIFVVSFKNIKTDAFSTSTEKLLPKNPNKENNERFSSKCHLKIEQPDWTKNFEVKNKNQEFSETNGAISFLIIRSTYWQSFSKKYIIMKSGHMAQNTNFWSKIAI